MLTKRKSVSRWKNKDTSTLLSSQKLPKPPLSSKGAHVGAGGSWAAAEKVQGPHGQTEDTAPATTGGRFSHHQGLICKLKPEKQFSELQVPGPAPPWVPTTLCHDKTIWSRITIEGKEGP